MYCRTDDRGDSVIQLAPPLISGQAEFDTIEAIAAPCADAACMNKRTATMRSEAMRRSGTTSQHRPDPVAATAVAPLPEPDFTAALHVVAVPGTAPEDVVADADGNIWTGVEDGRIIRIRPDGSSVQVVTDTGGRPLGLAVARDGRLLICDSHRGLLRYDPATGAIETLVAEIDGRPLTFCSNVVESSDGTIFFTESTSRFYYEYYKGSVIEGRPSGSLFRLDTDGTVSELAGGSVLRQRRDTDRRRVGVGVRRERRLPAVQVLAHRRAGRHDHPVGHRPAGLSRTTSPPASTAGSGSRWSRTATRSTNGWARARRSSAA